MSYQVLARKWRPRGFDTLVGQEHVVRALTHALQQGRLHHAYLFTGTRGVGKTTIARILAKSLNCETGVSATPCGVCGACQEIDTGRFVDLLEVDAATNTRVDEMRQLLENAVYAPTRGRYKVYVIDEVHMLSNAAFNAMLKTLEEPPEHVKFILATTDPQKIPVTVLSRCLQFNLKQMPLGSIVDHLTKVLTAESIPFDESALQSVARAANGSMRDALSLLDQAIAYGAGAVRTDDVSAMLGTLGNDHLYQIIDALIASDPQGLRRITEDLSIRSLSYDGALSSLAELWVRIQVAQFDCSADGGDESARRRDRDFAESLGAEYVQLAYAITLQGRAQLGLAPDPEAGFLMTLLRLYAFRPSEVAGIEKKNFVAEVASTNKSSAVTKVPLESGIDGKYCSAKVASAQSTTDSNGFALPLSPGGDWPAILAKLKLAGLARELASQCELVEFSSTAVVLRLSSAHRHLLNKASQDKLTFALAECLGTVNVTLTVGETTGETPAQLDARKKNTAHEAAVAAIESDPIVRDLIESFDASLIESSIRPLANE